MRVFHPVVARLVMLLVAAVLHGCGPVSQTLSDAMAANAADGPSFSPAGRTGGLGVPAMWQYTAPLIMPGQHGENGVIALKDPSVVFYQGRWHVFMTAKFNGDTRIVYTSFAGWKDAASAPRTVLKLTDSHYYAAPQVFYFAPQHRWYLIYQTGIPGKRRMQISYSTTADISDPASWSRARSIFLNEDDDPRQQGGLDYWVICDRQRAYLFFTTMDGRMWRMSTSLGDFPHGFGRLAIALQADIFEASHTYRLAGSGKYLTIVEAGSRGRRYYKAYVADRLDGDWTPLADSEQRPYAGMANVRPAVAVSAWADNISHGELIRTGIDQTMTVDPARPQFVFQGVLQSEKTGLSYGRIPWRIGILTPVGQAPPE